MAILTQFDPRLDKFLCQSDCFHSLSHGLNDEFYSVREVSISLLGRLSSKNPALIMPVLRRLLGQLLADLGTFRGDSIEQEESNQSIYVTQQNVSFRFWVLITCLVLLVTIKRILGSSSPPISMTIWLLIIIVLIILTYSLSTPAGFVMWFILILSIVLMKSGNLPSP
jgi:hypothetical protein